MKRTFILSLFLLVTIQFTQAGCREVLHRLFPLGEQNGQLVLAKFKMVRFCYEHSKYRRAVQKGEMADGYFWQGTAALGYWRADSFQVIRVVDNFEVRTGTFGKGQLRRDAYVKPLMPYYTRVLNAALRLKGFVKAVPVLYQHCSFDEALQFSMQVDLEAETQVTFGPGKKVIHQGELEYLDPGPIQKVFANRAYRIGKRTLWVYTLGMDVACGLKEEAYNQNIRAFKRIETGFLKEAVHWYGWREDRIYFEN